MFESLENAKPETKYRPDWIEQHCYVNGRPLSFKALGGKQVLGEYDEPSAIMHRPYIYPYLEDTADEKSAIKPRQSEFTVTNINDNIYDCRVNKYNVEHVFPSDRLATNISREKIGTTIRDSPTLSKLVVSANVHNYQFPGSVFYSISGALDKAAGRATSRDKILFDEWDEIPPSVAGVFLGQLEHSQHQKSGYVSTPTVPQIGIDAKVKEGSECEWHWTCEDCKQVQNFSFPENIINYFSVNVLGPESPKYLDRLRKVYIGCKQCKQPVDRNSEFYLAKAKFIPKKPHLQGVKSSYYINFGMLPWKTGMESMQKFHFFEQKGMIYQFHNEVWGNAFMESGKRLEPAEIMALRRDYAPLYTRAAAISTVSMGIDWGKTESWVVISAKGIEQGRWRRSVIYKERIDAQKLKEENFAIHDETQHVERAIQLVRQFRPDVVVNDSIGIGIDRHARMRQVFPGLVWGGEFDAVERNAQTLQTTLLECVWNESQHKVRIPKVKALKMAIAEVRSGQVGYPVYSAEQGGMFEIFSQHMAGLGVQTRFDEKTATAYDMAVRFGPDHFFCADIYSKTGFDKLNENAGNANNVPGIA